MKLARITCAAALWFTASGIPANADGGAFFGPLRSRDPDAGSLGLRHRWDNWLYSFGITENVQNINNTPDIGFQFGVAWISHRK
jgi:hypothetical protein